MYTWEIVWKEIPTQRFFFQGREAKLLYPDCDIVILLTIIRTHTSKGRQRYTIKTEIWLSKWYKRTNSEIDTNWGSQKNALKKRQQTSEAQATGGAGGSGGAGEAQTTGGAGGTGGASSTRAAATKQRDWARVRPSQDLLHIACHTCQALEDTENSILISLQHTGLEPPLFTAVTTRV